MYKLINIYNNIMYGFNEALVKLLFINLIKLFRE